MSEVRSADDAEAATPVNSVLTSILARNERLGKTSRLLGRMCFVGKVLSQQQRQLLAWHKDAIAKLRTESSPEDISGLLLLYPSHFLHVIEGELTQLTQFVQLLAPLAESGLSTAEVRVLASSDDIPSRLFPGWLSSTVGQHSGGATPADAIHVPMPRRIADTYIALLKLGRALIGAKKPDRDNMLNDLRTRYAETLPTQESVTEVATAEDALLIDEYIEVFCKPLDIRLDRELVWPIENELIY